MPADTFTDLSFEGIQQSLKNFLAGQDEFKDYDFEGSAMATLISLLAYNAQGAAFQANMQFNEAFLDSAEIRANVASIASMLGYIPKSKTAAQCLVTFKVTPSDASSAPAQLTTKHQQLKFIAVKDNTTYVFSPDKDYTATLVSGVYTFSNVLLVQGEWKATTWNVSGSAVQAYQINSTDIDTSTLSVSVQESVTGGTVTDFTLYSDLYTTATSDNTFFLRENRKGYYEIEFGDGVIFPKLDDGNVIYAEYIDTLGEDGNGISSFTPIGSAGGYSNISITKTEKSYNGSNQEEVCCIRKNAPLRFASGGNAVISTDYSAIVKQIFSEADDVISWGGQDNVPPAYGYDFIAIKPVSTETLSDSQKELLIAQLKERNVGSVMPYIVDPTYLYIHTDVSVKYSKAKTALNEISLASKVRDAISAYSESSLEAFGQDYAESRFSEAVNDCDVSILSNQVVIQLERRINPTLDVSTTYSIDMVYGVTVGTLEITGFSMPGTDTSVFEDYIKDNNGVLELRQRSEDSDTFVRNIGSVDGSVITIEDFAPTVLTDDYISVLCSVTEEDIEANQQDILTIVPGTITVTSS